MTTSQLETRLAWQQHLGDTAAARRWYDSVTARYREPHRAYHDDRHLRWVVRHVEALASDRELADHGAVVAAAFFHDVIYDPARPDNEAASARLAGSALTELGWTPERATLVGAMIEDTARHDVADVTVDRAVLFAADLAVLAASPGSYADYARNVRREYAHVDDRDWVTGRGAVLRSFLARPAIYAPCLALHDWEQRARGNLTAELETLGD